MVHRDSAAQIPGCNNVEADLYLNELQDVAEQQVNPIVVKNIKKTFDTRLDLFDSRINN